MKVYIDGAPLDMGTEGATIQKKTFIADGDFVDAFSQRLTIPLTANNMQLLDVYAPMERAWAQPHEADIQIDGWTTPQHGRLAVNAIHMQEQTAEITVYTSNSLNALADKKLRNLVADGPATLIEWKSGGGTANTGVYSYYRGAANSWAHPSVSLTWLWQQIAAATGATLPALPTAAQGWRVLCTGRRASVREYRQLVQTKWAGGGFTTDYSSASYYATADGGQTIIEYNGTVSFYGAGNYSIVTIQQVRAGSVIASTTYRSTSTTWTVQRGDIIRMGSAATGDTDVFLPLRLTHTPQALAEDDGRELGAWQPYSNPQYGTGFTTWSWGWFPIWRNLPDITLRQLLSVVAILTGRRLVEGQYWDASAPALAPVDDNEAVVETLEQSDRLAGRNLIVAEDGTAAPTVHTIATNGGSEKTFLTISGLYAAREYGLVAYVAQYNGGGGTTAASFNEVKGAPLLTTDGVSWSLLASPTLPDLLDGMTHAAEATIYSRADMRNAERIRVRGHVFLITEKDFNEDTETWEIHALLL